MLKLSLQEPSTFIFDKYLLSFLKNNNFISVFKFEGKLKLEHLFKKRMETVSSVGY